MSIVVFMHIVTGAGNRYLNLTMHVSKIRDCMEVLG